MVLLIHNLVVKYYEARFDFYPKDVSIGIGLQYAFMTYFCIMLVCSFFDTFRNTSNMKWVYLAGLMIFFLIWCFALEHRPLRFLNLYMIALLGTFYLMLSNFIIDKMLLKYFSKKTID